MRPEILSADGMVRVTVEEELMEKPHVLETKNGELVLWLGKSISS